MDLTGAKETTLRIFYGIQTKICENLPLIFQIRHETGPGKQMNRTRACICVERNKAYRFN